jgi:RNA polymerase sigma-70 factor (ECF subfamily)
MSAVDTDELSGGESVERLYRRHRAWLLGLLARRFGASVGEEAVQEAFARSLAGGSRIRNPRAFLAKVAVRAALEEVRRRPEPEFVLQPLTSVAHPDAEVALVLEETILSLPEPIRAAFLMSRFSGLTNAEIAARLGISVKRVEARLSEARRLCAVALQK